MPPIKKMMQGVPRSFAQQRPAIQIPVQPNRSVGVFRIGGEVSAPILVSKVEPAYTEEARKAKYSGTVLLSIVIGADGLPRNVHVIRPLGHGLDEKAIEAVMKWRFRPGMKGGQAVATQAQVEVNFRLL
jgi:protein TonB